MILGPEGKKHFDLKYSKELRTVSASGREEKKKQIRASSSFPRQSWPAASVSRGKHRGSGTWPLQPIHTHPPRTVVDKTFTNSGREKCGRLHCHTLKLDISGATRVHESPKDVKIQMDINVQ